MDYQVEQLKAKIKEYERRMGIGEFDPAKEGYLVLVKILDQQNKYLKNIVIKDMIVSEDKGKSNEYERAKGLWEKLPNMISSVNELRITLKMEGEDKREIQKSITAASIADGEE
jgi:hypothetical protein